MYAKAEHSILAKKSSHIIGNVLIHPTAEVDPSAVVRISLPSPSFFLLPTSSLYSSSEQLGPNVTIGKNVKIGKGVRILHSIILDGAEIKVNKDLPLSIYPHLYKTSRRMRASCMVSLDGSVLWVNGRA